MTRERLLEQYNVDVNKVTFEKSANGLYEFSVKSVGDYYITNERDGYHVVCGNSYTRFTCDLSAIEG